MRFRAGGAKPFLTLSAALGSTQEGFWAAPSGTEHFTGRVDFLEKLHASLSTEANVGLTQAISGLGGVGKTSVAIRYAEEYRSHYCRVFWLNAASADTLNASFREFLENVLELSAEKMDVETVRTHIKAFFTDERRWPASRPWLIIFDNVEDSGVVRPFVPTFGRGRCLFTSRLRDLFPLTKGDALSLDVFQPAEALSFLKEFTGRSPEANSNEEKAAIGLAEDLGHLPLALEQAAAYIRKMRGKVSFAGYRQKFREEPLPYLDREDPVFYDRKGPDGYLWTVAKTWNINFAGIADQPVAQLLRCLAFLAPDRIPLEIFQADPTVFGPPLDAALQKAGADEEEWENLLKPALDLSLLRYTDSQPDPNTGVVPRPEEQNTLTLHRLVQEVIRAQMPSEEQQAQAEQSVQALCAADPGTAFEDWPRCERLLPHWRQSAGYIQRYVIESVEAGALLIQAGYYLTESGQYAEAEPLLVQALAFGRRHCRRAIPTLLPASTIWRRYIERSATRKRPNRSWCRRLPLCSRRCQRVIPTLQGASTIWRSCIGNRAATKRPNRCMSRRWQSLNVY